MAQFLPLRANLEWLKKLCKDRLEKASDPNLQLADVQLAVAREYGFSSWRKLKEHVELVRAKLQAAFPHLPVNISGSEVVPPDDLDLKALLTAVENGDNADVAQMLSRRPILANARGPDGQSPLHVAARCNDPRLGLYLLAYGANPDAKFGQSGHTAMSWAVTCNAMEFAQALVRIGNRPDLFCAAGIGDLESIHELFDEKGQLLDDACQTGSSRFTSDGERLPCPPETERERISDALYIACRNGHAAVARFLLEKKPDLSFRAYLGGTPLHWAYFGGSKDVIEQLLKAGADTTLRDDSVHCTPRVFGITVLANWGFNELVQKRLRDQPTLADATDGQTTPLHEAVRGGHVGVVRTLLDAGADVLLRDANGNLALELAMTLGNVEVVRLLREVHTSK